MKNYFKIIIVILLQLEARLVLKKYKPNIIAVVGSVGKTTTKDAIYTVLSTSFFVRKSEKSFNSEIGIPLTILGCPNGWSNPFIWFKNLLEGLALIVLRNHYPKWLILEVGADRPGDIKKIASWLKPDMVVVTRLPSVPVHVEFFNNPEDVIKEKKYIVDALKPNGTLILNSDDSKVMALKETVPAKVFTYGFLKGADLVVLNDFISYKGGKPLGMRFRVDYRQKSIPIITTGAIGRQNVYPTLAAIAVGFSQNLNMVTMGQALLNHETPPGRMRVIDGIKNSLIIDDTYNSSPIAATEALNTLEKVSSAGVKIAVLGDMMELGRYSVDEHIKVGQHASKICDLLITVGVRARHIAEGALNSGMSEKNIRQYDDAKRAGKELESTLAAGDIVLIKGSQSVRMEQTVAEIMAHPENQKQLLVRQEKEWNNR